HREGSLAGAEIEAIDRQIINVAAGTEGTDAVNLDQLNAVADHIDGVAEGMVAYDDEGRGSVTFAGEEGTRLRNLAAGKIGAASTDAVHGGQVFASLQSTADVIGGGTVVDARGQLIGTVFPVQGSYYGNIGDALGALDVALTGLDGRVADLEQEVSGHGAGGATVAAARGEPAAGDGGGKAVAGTAAGQGDDIAPGTSDRDGDARAGAASGMTAAGDGQQRRITRVSEGVDDHDAANVAQVDAGDARTLDPANAYTDARFSAWEDNFTALRSEVDERFRHQDRRIDRMGAMSGAYAGMALNTAGLAGRNRVGVGVGAQGGEQAIAVGYQRAIGARASVSLGGAISGGESSVSAGAGFSW